MLEGIDGGNWEQSWTRLRSIGNTRTSAEVWPQRQKKPEHKKQLLEMATAWETVASHKKSELATANQGTE
jgi:hypothetical protein